MIRRNHMRGAASVDDILDGTTTSSATSTGGSGIAALLLMELDRPGGDNSRADDLLPYSSSPSSSPSSTPTRSSKNLPSSSSSNHTRVSSRKSSSYIAALKEAGRRRPSRNSIHSPEKNASTTLPSTKTMENDDNDRRMIRSIIKHKEVIAFHDDDDDSHIISSTPKIPPPTTASCTEEEEDEQITPPRANRTVIQNVQGPEKFPVSSSSMITSPSMMIMNNSPNNRAPWSSSSSTGGPPISPFSPLFHKRRRRPQQHRKPPPVSEDDEKTKSTATSVEDEEEEMHRCDDLSLSVCRKVSVVVLVMPGENHNHHRCLFPAADEELAIKKKKNGEGGGEPLSSGKVEEEEGEDNSTAFSMTTSRELIVVNPSAFSSHIGVIPTEVTMETARYMAHVAQISSTEDWARIYKYHQVIWSSSSSGDGTSSTSLTATTEAFHHISQAIANDIVAPGSIAHRIVVGTSTGPTRMGAVQTAQLYGIVGQQSVARVFAAPSDTSTLTTTTTDILQRYGLAGLTVHRILQRMSQEDHNCTVSILEVSAEGDEVLFDLLASRPFAKIGNHSVTIRGVPAESAAGTTFKVDGLSETRVESLKQFGHLIRRAFTAALHVNRRSPRGHIIVSVYWNPRDHPTHLPPRTSCHFIDLAVAECESSSSSATNHLRRNTAIRQSLGALGGVLRGLLLKEAGNEAPVPSYRDAVLTKVLQRSLIPTDSRTIVLATVAPEVDQYEETMSTLRYVNRLLYRPGHVAQSPFASSLGGPTMASDLSSPLSSRGFDRSLLPSPPPPQLRLDQFAGQERVLLKEIVSDPRQRLAKVLKPVTNKVSESVPPPKQGLEKYVPTDYSDPEDDPRPSSLQIHESINASSPGEADDWIEIEEYWDDAAPTPQTRNVGMHHGRVSSVQSETESVPNSMERERGSVIVHDFDSDRNISAMDEFLESEDPFYHRPLDVSPLTADTGRTSRFGFPDDVDPLDDVLMNQSHTLDDMAVQVAENRAFVTKQDAFVVRMEHEKSKNQHEELIDPLTDKNDYIPGQLEDILREGSIEEEIVFSGGLQSSQPELKPEEKSLESLLREPDYEYEDDFVFKQNDIMSGDGFAPGHGDVKPYQDQSMESVVQEKVSFPDSGEAFLHTHTNDPSDIGRLRGTRNVTNRSLAPVLKGQEVEESFTTYELPAESPIDRPMVDSADSKDEHILVSTEKSTNEDFIDSGSYVQADAYSVSSTQRFQSVLSGKSNIESAKQRPSTNVSRTLPSFYWNKMSSSSIDASQLTDAASRKVQDEIDQLQAAVDKVKQTNISVWQSSLDSLNNLRYFQTAYQDALAQLLAEREVANKEIKRLMTELDRRSEELEQMTSQYENDIEVLSLHKSNIESERFEVVKIAEEAIATQAELEQRVTDLELQLSEKNAASVPRNDYNALKQMKLSYEQELFDLKSQHSKLMKELEAMESTKSTLSESLDISENDRKKVEKEARASALEVSHLEKELQSVTQQLMELLDDNKAKDEYIFQCKQEVDAAKSDLVAHQEASKADAELWKREIARSQDELAQVQEKYYHFPAKLEEVNRQISQLQMERDNLAQALEEAEQSLFRRISDVRELTDNLKALLSEKEKDQSKISRMEKALSSFQEETRSRLETILSHRNEAASLLEKTVIDNKALVEVNGDMQLSIERLQRERDEAKIQLRELSSDHALTLEGLTNDNRILLETNQKLRHEIASFRRRHSEHDKHYSDEPIPRVSGETRNYSYPNASSSLQRDQYPVAEPTRYSFENLNGLTAGSGKRTEHTDVQLAEEVAASVAFSAKAAMETNSSETNLLKEKLFALEDTKDDEINALKLRVKSLERRLCRTPSRYIYN